MRLHVSWLFFCKEWTEDSCSPQGKAENTTKAERPKVRATNCQASEMPFTSYAKKSFLDLPSGDFHRSANRFVCF